MGPVRRVLSPLRVPPTSDGVPISEFELRPSAAATILLLRIKREPSWLRQPALPRRGANPITGMRPAMLATIEVLHVLLSI